MSEPSETFIDFVVHGLAVDRESDMPILLLRDWACRLMLPIWIGRREASAIISAIEEIKLRRPSTHDLMGDAVEALGGRVVAVEICSVAEGTFLGSLLLQDAHSDQRRLDCRPSDGVALAVRFGAPIRVAPSVLEAAQPFPKDQERSGSNQPTPLYDADDVEALKNRLEEMDPADFGEFET